MFVPSFTIEKKFLNSFKFIAGIDEVGRAPLAGPVVAAAVVLNPVGIGARRSSGKWWAQVRDSKALSAQKRKMLATVIRENSLDWAIGMASNREIDELNIHHATFLAMRRAIENLKSRPETILIDGKFLLPGMSVSEQRAIIGGDAKVLSISCASILAKVYRDEWMEQYAQKNPAFGFEQHKGYPTHFHRNKILHQGPCVIHRMSFATVRKIVNQRFEKMLE